VTLSPDRSLQLRIVGTLVLVVSLNGLFLTMLAWSVIRVVSIGGLEQPWELSVPLSVGLTLVGAFALVGVQARYGSRFARSKFDLESLEHQTPSDLEARIHRLAAQADIPTPSVAVVECPEPSCLTVGRQRSPTIVVTTGLLERLEAEELEAALAHEIAHIVNRDLPVVTAVAAMVAIGDRLLERERTLRRFLGGMVIVALFSGVGLLLLALPIVVLTALYLVVSVVARVVLAVNSIALGLFSKTREYAADRGASRLTGNPAALASALETLEPARPNRDGRMQVSATLGIVAQPLTLDSGGDGEESTDQHWFDRWFVDQFSLEPVESESQPEDRSNGAIDRTIEHAKTWLRVHVITPIRSTIVRVLTWRPPTHPPTAARIEQLQTLERRQQR